ncbi:AarF/UbiB family protein, partial [uncultured Limosilactobacillus sp.]|uniref:ABC1 kinase family protein n=1 Tax=uncultured Limosilactobacillus sp. TaxID=2837629 RepID=UPI0025CEC369
MFLNEEKTAISQTTRLKQIIKVLNQHSFLTNFYRQKHPEEIRQALEELGPTFIKIGQLLSTRPDLVSPAYIKELRQLQDHVDIDPYETVEQTFEEQTGKRIDEVFKTFDKIPFASASIGQTHHATLFDGTNVVVKVQHPAVTQLIQTDLALFKRALGMVEHVPMDFSVIDPKRVLDELSTSLLHEIDTTTEVQNGQEFYRLNNEYDIIEVPRVYPKYCTQKILVNEAMPGQSIKQLMNEKNPTDEKLAAKIKERNHYLAHVLVENFIKQVFADHFFHADPHPGNVLFYELKPDDPKLKATSKDFDYQKQLGSNEIEIQKEHPLPPYRLVYLDFGMMGHLSPALTDGIAKVVIALNTKSTRQVGQAILGICNRTGEIDEQNFYSQLGSFLSPYLNAGLGGIDLPTMLFQIISLCRQNNLQVKPEVTLLIKAFSSIEGIVAALDPEMSLMEVAKPFAKKYLLKHFNWRDSLESSIWQARQTALDSAAIPSRVNDLLEVLSTGQAKINFQYKDQARVLRNLERMLNRLLIVIVLAAIILGSSILVEGSNGHPAIFKLGTAGYSIAIIVI